MSRLAPQRASLATLATIVGLFAAAAPARAGTAVGNPGDAQAHTRPPATGICAFPDVCLTAAAGPSGAAPAVLYKGHAGLGATGLTVPDMTVIPN